MRSELATKEEEIKMMMRVIRKVHGLSKSELVKKVGKENFMI